MSVRVGAIGVIVAVGLGYGAKSIAVASVDPVTNREADQAVMTAGGQGLQVAGGLAAEGVASAGDVAGSLLTETKGLAGNTGLLTTPPTQISGGGLPVQPAPTPTTTPNP
jgi:hypothetical protein